VSQYSNEDGVDFVVLKYRWRWKQVEEEEDVAAEEEAPKCEAVTSTCSAGEKFGQEAAPPGHVDAGVENGQLAVAGAEPSRTANWIVREAEQAGPGLGRSGGRPTNRGRRRARGALSFQINHFLAPSFSTITRSNPVLSSCRSCSVDMNKEEEEKNIEAPMCTDKLLRGSGRRKLKKCGRQLEATCVLFIDCVV
jgi:hypothetical protein